MRNINDKKALKEKLNFSLFTLHQILVKNTIHIIIVLEGNWKWLLLFWLAACLQFDFVGGDSVFFFFFLCVCVCVCV